MSSAAAPDLGRRGLMLVLSSPSGAGKTTLARRLLEGDPGVEMSVSVTTRAPREGEIEGRDYRFVDDARFAAMRDGGELLEWATVFGRMYGTPKAPVTQALASGRDVLFDIDWQGARQLTQACGPDVVRVFVLPPSALALAERLRTRNQDSAESVANRLAGAAAEMSHWPEYHYVIVNAGVTESVAGLRAILAAERLRRERLGGLEAFVRGLRGA